MNRFTEYIIKLRWLIVTAAFLLTIFFGFQITKLHINADIISSLPDDDPVAKLVKDIGTEFGGNDMGMIVLETDDVFNAGVIERIRTITDSVRFTQGVSNVTSLTNILDIKSGIIQSKFTSVDMKDIEAFTERMNRYIEENQNDLCEIEITGMPSVYVKLNNSLIKSQYNNLLVAINMIDSGFGALTLLSAILILANRKRKITANNH